MVFKRIVDVIQYLAIACAVVVVALFAYRPSAPSAGGGATAAGAGKEQARVGGNGSSVYIANCATCHGSKGEGGIGPKLGGGTVASRFPNVADEVLLVSAGRDGMPGWSGRLTADEIRAVVEYTRTGL